MKLLCEATREYGLPLGGNIALYAVNHLLALHLL